MSEPLDDDHLKDWLHPFWDTCEEGRPVSQDALLTFAEKWAEFGIDMHAACRVCGDCACYVCRDWRRMCGQGVESPPLGPGHCCETPWPDYGDLISRCTGVHWRGE